MSGHDKYADGGHYGHAKREKEYKETASDERKVHKGESAMRGRDEAEMDLTDKMERRNRAPKIEGEADRKVDGSDELKRGGRAKRKHGGHVHGKHVPLHMEHHKHELGHRHKRRHGGKTEEHKVEGEHHKMHAGRKPRASGGRSDVSPFTSALHGTPAKGRPKEQKERGTDMEFK